MMIKTFCHRDDDHDDIDTDDNDDDPYQPLAFESFQNDHKALMQNTFKQITVAQSHFHHRERVQLINEFAISG